MGFAVVGLYRHMFFSDFHVYHHVEFSDVELYRHMDFSDAGPRPEIFSPAGLTLSIPNFSCRLYNEIFSPGAQVAM